MYKYNEKAEEVKYEVEETVVDEVVEEIVQLEDKVYKIDGTVNIDEVFELYEMYEEDIYDSNTLSGWIIEIHEKVPSVNEIVRFKNLEIEILEVLIFKTALTAE